MTDPAVPADSKEAERLAALGCYDILDTPAEPGFDDIVQLAAQICGTPTALVSLVAGDRQWFKARLGFELPETPIEQSVCQHAFAQPGLLVIPDLSRDARTVGNRLVTESPCIRFYAGARLDTPEGQPLGTLCVIDTAPRPEGLAPAQASALEALARQVMAQMELRRVAAARDAALKAAREADRRRRLILASATDYAIIALDRQGLVTDWNTGAERIFGWPAQAMLGETAERIFTPEDQATDRLGVEMKGALHTGQGTDERWHLREDGSRFWANGEIMPLRDEAGEHLGFIKIVRDETDRRAAAEKLRLSEEFLQGVLAASEDCIQVLDLDGNLLFMSEGGRRAMEVADFASIRGRPWPVRCPDALRPTAQAAVAAARAGGTGHYQGPTDTFAGRTKWWDVRVTPILDGDRRPESLLAISRDITAARHAETDLRRSQERLSLALSASGMVGIWDWDLKTGLVFADANFARIYGVDPEAAATGAPIAAFTRNFHPEDLPAFEAELQRQIEGADEFVNEYRILQPDGSVRWVLARGRLVRDAEGAPARLPGAAVDITDRKQAEARRLAVLELGDYLRDATDPAAMAFKAAEIMGRTLDLSRAGYGAVDLAREQVSIKRDWSRPETAGIAGTHAFRQFGSFVDDLKRGRTVVVGDATRDPRTRDKAAAFETIAVRSMINVPILEGGRFVALFYLHDHRERGWSAEQVAFVRNVADRTRAAIERQRAETDLRTLNDELERRVEERTRERNRLWETTNDLMATAGFDGYLTAVNPAWTAMLGWDERELLARPLADFVRPTEPGGAAHLVDGLAAREPVAGLVDRVACRDGTERTIMWTAVPEAPIFYVVGRDLTAQRHVEEQLRQAQKMEAVGQLTGGVAHDFNNLLTVIRSSVDLLKRPSLAEERRQRYIEAIADATTRAAKLTGQLLAFARRQTLNPEVFDAVASVRAMRDMVLTLAGSRIGIDMAVPAVACLVHADSSQFDTALVNLCVNARDAMESEGRITITVEGVSRIPPLRGEPAVPGDFVAVSIGDTGTGIPEGDLDRIFEPFFTTKEVGQGTGLGLSQVFGFVKQSGGEVGVRSVVGRGTTFTLFLPRAAQGQRARGVQPEAAASTDGHGLRVLVVEDNPDVGSFAMQTLQELGYDAVLAQAAGAALDRLAAEAGRFDVVFSDVVMPGMNGIELAQEIRRRYPDLPVLLTSGYSHVLAEKGTSGFELLHKPYSVETLSRALIKAAGPRRLLAV